MSRVKITPPSNKRVRITPPQGNQIPMAKYGQAVDNSKQHMFEFDNRWNPGSYQGQIGVNPDPDPYARTGNTLPEVGPDKANVNAELDEQVVGNFTPDGLPSLMAVGGPSHAKGGKDIKVPDGSFIFSTTPSLTITNPYGEQSPQSDGIVTAKKGGSIHTKEKQSGIGLPYGFKDFGASKPTTPAKLAKQYKLQNYTKTLSDPKSDPVSKKTAELMVANYGGKLNQLAELQEAKKKKMGLGDNQQQQPQMPIAQLGGGRYDDVFDANGYGNTQKSSTSQSSTGNSGNRKVRVHSPIDPGNSYSGEPFRFDQNPVPVDNGNTAADMYNRRMYGDNIAPLPIDLVVQLPTSIPQPTNMSQVSNPDTRLGSYGTTDDKQQTNVPFTAPTPDKWGFANSLLNAATIHRYPGWEAPNGAVTPNTVFEDPTRAIAATQEAANASGYNNALSGNSRAARAQSAASQGIAGEQAANIAASTNNRNVQVSNQASEKVADIANRLHAENAQRLSKMYQENVISAQQYDNSMRDSRNDAVKQAQTMWNDRSKLDFLNKTSPYFYDNPNTGARGFKSPEAKAHFNNEINHLSSGTGISQDTLGKYKQAYDAAVAKGLNPIRADKYAAEYAGMTDRERDKLNQVGIMQNETVSKSEVEGHKFGGNIKPKPMKFGGSTQHQLKKFVNKSFSK